MYEVSYLSYQDLDALEYKIETKTDEIISNYSSDIPAYYGKAWHLNEPILIQQFDKIETAIENIGEYFIKPDGWIPTKKWLKDENTIDYFSFKDWNRWINNLDIIDTTISGITLWNGVSLIDWNIESIYEWEE